MKAKLTWFEIILLAAPFVALALSWNEVPARIAIHWDLHGEVNGWAAKEFGLFLVPLLSLGIVALFHLVPRFDPRLRHTLQNDDRMSAVLPLLCVAVAAFSDVIFGLILAVALGHTIAVGRIVLVISLLLLAVMGNYLGTLRPNYFIGIRTPWTLENADTWRATHRLGGRLMFFGAIILLVLQFCLKEEMLVMLFVGALLALAVWAFAYSWHHTRTDVAPR